ncbi:beta-alanine-activating enzyme isoform X2 [Lepisosteus oculatus]|uniref:beta-alanine-activating enzyme isoform X2 n=1 Tax=Lepisosteus oculatus TaxID=7918 RepID=UPI0035F4FFFE
MDGATLHELVRAAGCAHGHRVAVRFEDGTGAACVSRTYAELLASADELSTLLKRCRHLRNERVFGLYCQPGVHLASWILGILQVPAAYLPVDPEAPSQLSAGVLRQSGLEYILVQSDLIQRFQNSFSTYLRLEVSEELPSLSVLLVEVRGRAPSSPLAGAGWGERAAAQADSRAPGSLAYILHTSGTTGPPKTVRVPHSCIVPNILHLRSLFQMTPKDVVFVASPLTFDPSVVELFLALSTGASLLIVPSVVKMIPSKLAEILFKRHHVSVMQATPTLIKMFGTSLLQTTVLSAATSLRVLALGGEAFPCLSVLRSWKEEGNQTQVFNLYGITEVSCWATCYQIPEGAVGSSSADTDSVPLGSPLLGTTVEVRDERGSVITHGEGQVFLGGGGRVCSLGDEAEAAAPGAMRGTGDWVELRGGHMYYLGRRDRLLKRHGKRLSLEALQETIERLGLVQACAVTLHEGKRLLAFVVPAGQHTDLESTILRSLSELLPLHSVPDQLLTVEALPLTLHGKVDLAELAKVYEQQRGLSVLPAALNGRADLWERLQALWKGVLGLPEDAVVPSESMFLSSGGDSIRSLRLLEEIEAAVGRATPGLLEVILSRPFSDLCRGVEAVAFPVKRGGGAPGRGKRRLAVEASPAVAKPRRQEVAGERAPEPAGFVVVRRAGQVLRRSPGESSEALRERTRDKSDASQDSGGAAAPAGGSIESGAATGSPSPQQEDAPLRLKVRWKSDTGKCVDASPALLACGEGGPVTAYVGSHSRRMQAIDMDSGARRWERVLGDRIESSAAVTRCGRLVVVGCYDGLVYVLRADSGETYWTFPTGSSVKSCPTVDLLTGLVFIGSHDGHVYALNTEARRCAWSRHCGGGAVFSSPALHCSPRQLYVATLGSRLLALSPDSGDTIWEHAGARPFFSSPCCSEEAVCLGSVDGSILCFSHAGAKLWQFSTSGPVFSSPCLAPAPPAGWRLLCGSHDGSVYCLSARGELLWRFRTTGKVFASPFVFGGGGGRGGPALVAVASADGRLWVLDAADGALRGSHSFPGEVFSSPVVWGRGLCVGCRNDFVYCLEF